MLWARVYILPQKLPGWKSNSHMGDICGCHVKHKLKRIAISVVNLLPLGEH